MLESAMSVANLSSAHPQPSTADWQVLASNDTITALDLSHCNLTGESREIYVLCHCGWLALLCALTPACCTESACISLGRTLRKNSSLKILNLEHNNLPEQAGEALLRGAISNR